MLVRFAVTLGATLSMGFGATDALGATLSVSVSPATVHPGHRYVITINGRYSRRPKPPYLLAFIQYSGRACRATATAEYRLPTSDWTWDFYPQRAETTSPFKTATYWKAGTSLGTRRVCAYLYAAPVTPSTMAGPLARASAAFSNTRR